MIRDEDPRGLCADDPDPDVWFSESFADQVRAKSICHECPFLTTCLAIAVEEESGKSKDGRFGVWGGMTPDERARIKHARRKSRARKKPPTGRRPVQWTPAELVARTTKLAAEGHTVRTAAAALGYAGPESLRSLLRQRGHLAPLEALKANEPSRKGKYWKEARA